MLALVAAAQGKSAKKGKTAEEKPAGADEKPAYVHVRARRGQATDSHSLAERVSTPSPSSSFPAAGGASPLIACPLAVA